MAARQATVGMAMSRPRIRDNSAENVFGLYNGDVFLQPLSNFTIQYVFEVRAAPESGFVCRVRLFNGDDQGYVHFDAYSSYDSAYSSSTIAHTLALP